MRIQAEFAPITIHIDSKKEKDLLLNILDNFMYNEESTFLKWNTDLRVEYSFAKDLIKGLK